MKLLWALTFGAFGRTNISQVACEPELPPLAAPNLQHGSGKADADESGRPAMDRWSLQLALKPSGAALREMLPQGADAARHLGVSGAEFLGVGSAEILTAASRYVAAVRYAVVSAAHLADMSTWKHHDESKRKIVTDVRSGCHPWLTPSDWNTLCQIQVEGHQDDQEDADNCHG